MTPLWQLPSLYPHFPKQIHISLKFTWRIKQTPIYVLNLIGSIAILLLLSHNFSETTLLQVHHNFGVIFKFVFSLFFFSFSVSDNQVMKFPPLKVSDRVTPTLFITILWNLSKCTEIIYIYIFLSFCSLQENVKICRTGAMFYSLCGRHSKQSWGWMIKWIPFF